MYMWLSVFWNVLEILWGSPSPPRIQSWCSRHQTVLLVWRFLFLSLVYANDLVLMESTGNTALFCVCLQKNTSSFRPHVKTSRACNANPFMLKRSKLGGELGADELSILEDLRRKISVLLCLGWCWGTWIEFGKSFFVSPSAKFG